MDDRIVTVAVVTSRVEAELIVGMLESSGVPAMYSADDVGRQEPQLQLQGVRVMVAAPDEPVARVLLAEAEDRAETRTETRAEAEEE